LPRGRRRMGPSRPPGTVPPTQFGVAPWIGVPAGLCSHDSPIRQRCLGCSGSETTKGRDKVLWFAQESKFLVALRDTTAIRARPLVAHLGTNLGNKTLRKGPKSVKQGATSLTNIPRSPAYLGSRGRPKIPGAYLITQRSVGSRPDDQPANGFHCLISGGVGTDRLSRGCHESGEISANRLGRRRTVIPGQKGLRRHGATCRDSPTRTVNPSRELHRFESCTCHHHPNHCRNCGGSVYGAGSTKAQRRKTNHLIEQYMYTASQMPATIRDSW
jgi:hypothetical protein